MDRVSVMSLCYGDVIMADCRVVKNPTPVGWDVCFIFRAMSVLARVPGGERITL